ncbi:hypothetical protein [Rubinisphaera italica]|uniref:Transmembrane protein n=1 Tax=Rubinisphaera italica TaxID=2527969 RepID=A0A5C5XK04_9PLAN|nr:hypothetical protein [Rubinisphaera italica]TWT62741.1 hypothetical protein Pan54_34860 [Rubinisphaera italica]
MPLNRPPLMSQWQTYVFYSYMAICTGMMFLAGGLATIPLGLCGAGAVANNHRSKGHNVFNPYMKLLPLDLVNASPPPPWNDGGLTSVSGRN